MLPASVISFIQKRRDLIVDQILARYLSPRLRHYYFRFLKTNGRHIGILLLVSILTFYRHSHVTMHRPTKFRRNWTIGNGFMTSCRLLTWRLQRPKSISGFRFGDVAHFRRSKSICKPNFDETSQSTAEILLHPVSGNKRLPY